jgi:L-malate glycosyltransferase
MMRILILTPTFLPSVTGNAITVERWRRSLVKKGLDVQVIATQGSGRKKELLDKADTFQPQVIHVHHAFRAGALALDPGVASRFAKLPMVVSTAGTDINVDLGLRARKEIVLRLLERASVVVVQNREAGETLKRLFPGHHERILYVPKSFCWMGDEAFDLRGIAGCEPGDFLFFLPAGIRPVKRNRECLALFEKLHAARPRSRIVFAGPSLHSGYALRFEREVEKRKEFARWVPMIRPQAMRSAYESADAVLNTSSSEGLSNALIEAMAAGCPILASDIQGNRWPVLGENGDPPSGYLFRFRDPEDFMEKALSLVDDRNVRADFVRASRKRAGEWPSPETEADGLILAYQRAAMGAQHNN